MTDLYTVCLCFRSGQRQNLAYDSLNEAETVYATLAAGIDQQVVLQFLDEYGTKIALFSLSSSLPLEAIILQDNVKAHEVGVEMSLIQARAQARAQSRANHDPTLRLAQRAAILPG